MKMNNRQITDELASQGNGTKNVSHSAHPVTLAGQQYILEVVVAGLPACAAESCVRHNSGKRHGRRRRRLSAAAAAAAILQHPGPVGLAQSGSDQAVRRRYQARSGAQRGHELRQESGGLRAEQVGAGSWEQRLEEAGQVCEGLRGRRERFLGPAKNHPSK